MNCEPITFFDRGDKGLFYCDDFFFDGPRSHVVPTRWPSRLSWWSFSRFSEVTLVTILLGRTSFFFSLEVFVQRETLCSTCCSIVVIKPEHTLSLYCRLSTYNAQFHVGSLFQRLPIHGKVADVQNIRDHKNTNFATGELNTTGELNHLARCLMNATDVLTVYENMCCNLFVHY